MAERNYHCILLQEDTGGESLHLAAPLLAEALSLVRGATLLTNAARYVADQAELFPPPGAKHAMEEAASPERAAFRPTYRHEGFPRGATSTLFSDTLTEAGDDTHNGDVGDELHSQWTDPKSDSRAYLSADERNRERGALHVQFGQLLDACFQTYCGLPMGPSQRHVRKEPERQPPGPSAVKLHDDLLQCREGLVLPRAARADHLFRAFPLLRYGAFCADFERLSTIAASGVVYTAAEARLKVLQGRYRLHQAFNGQRENQHHPTLGGGDFSRAAKVDIRRMETSMSATTLIAFMEEKVATEPDSVVRVRHKVGARKTAVVDHLKVQDGARARESPNLTLRHAVDVFFGPRADESERLLTAEGLCLLPNYADVPEKSLDLFDKTAPSNPRRAHAAKLLRHFVKIDYGNSGQFLAELLKRTVQRVTRQPTEILELEIPLHGLKSDEIATAARWCRSHDFFVLRRRVRLSLRISLISYSDKYPARTLEDVLRHIFEPLWRALLEPGEHTDIVRMLQLVTSISVSLDGEVAKTRSLPKLEHPSEFGMRPVATVTRADDDCQESSEAGHVASPQPQPPVAFFAYHVWRNVVALNSFIASHLFLFNSLQRLPPGENMVRRKVHPLEGADRHCHHCPAISVPETSYFRHTAPLLQRPFMLRLHASSSSTTSFTEAVAGLMLSEQVVNPSDIVEWSPLAYLYYLTQRSIVLTPSRSLSTTTHPHLRHALPFAVEAGLNAFVASYDPLFYHKSDDALCEEYNTLLKTYNLSGTDISEMCCRSVEASNLSLAVRSAALGTHNGEALRSDRNEFTKSNVCSLRLFLREIALEHEAQLLSAAMGRQGTPRWLVAPRHTDARSGSGISTTTALALWKEQLLVYFGIPLRQVPRCITSTASPTASQPFRERHVDFARIVIHGPSTLTRNESARQISVAMAKRHRYLQYRFENAPDVQLAAQAPSEQAVPPANAQCDGSGFAVYLQRWMAHLAHNTTRSSADRATQDAVSSAFTAFTCTDGVFDVVPCAREKMSDATGYGGVAVHWKRRCADEAAKEVRRRYCETLPTWAEYQRDCLELLAISGNPNMRAFSKQRLRMLESKFLLHSALTDDDEAKSFPSVASASGFLRSAPDLYRVTKVDVHCHMASGVTARSLLQFIQEKLKTCPNDFVGYDKSSGKPMTLLELFGALLSRSRETVGRPLPQAPAPQLDASQLTVASLNVHVSKKTFNRFDDFNGRYNPFGISEMRSLFLKTDNEIGGRYFAELIKHSFSMQREDGSIFSEFRLSIYGRSKSEWEGLARWFVLQQMNDATNRWVVQIPRLYHLYKRDKIVANFEEMLRNIFEPLWEASMWPERYPVIDYFLLHVSGFDSVDNESDREHDETVLILPREWDRADNPPFRYWMYHMWANITTLNRFRAWRGLSTFSFRPHAGESGDPDHMADAFLLADGVNHGINVVKRPVIQYLFYLAQIPLAIVPLSNNALFCKYKNNPFPVFFRQGLNVALSTDGWLQFHHTQQPLLEEYSTAAKFWELSPVDLCEVAKRSVLMSGFPHSKKAEWLGPLYFLSSVLGNDEKKSFVPNSRCCFRYEVYLDEVRYLERRAAVELRGKAMLTPLEEELVCLDVLGKTRSEVLGEHLGLHLPGQSGCLLARLSGEVTRHSREARAADEARMKSLTKSLKVASASKAAAGRAAVPHTSVVLYPGKL